MLKARATLVAASLSSKAHLLNMNHVRGGSFVRNYSVSAKSTFLRRSWLYGEYYGWLYDLISHIYTHTVLSASFF